MMGNYIERDYLQYRILEECESPSLTKEADEMLSTIYGLVINAPSRDVEYVTHAHWIKSETGLQYVCSNCNRRELWMNAATYEYCPHCGAKMDEVSLRVL